MSNVPERPDPAADQRRAIKYAARQVDRWRKAERDMASALHFAHRHTDASLRQLEEATGVPFKTIDRIIKRHDDEADEGGQEAS